MDKLAIIMHAVKSKGIAGKKELFWTIPNVLTVSRMCAFPFTLFFIYAGKENIVAILIAGSLFSDWLDGIIARTFNMKTEIGAKMDSWADTGTYISAIIAIYFFKWDAIAPYAFTWYLFLAVWLFSYVFVFIKFKGLIGLHTYLFKSTGYVQGAFIIVLFIWGFYPVLFYICMFVGILACVEEIIIISMLTEPRTNVKGLFWILREKSNHAADR
jgi:cardiolipin synthase